MLRSSDRGSRLLTAGFVGFVLGCGALAVSFPSLGQEAAVKQTPAAAARGRANDEMERLRMEIRVLTELRDAQEALRAWNRLRVEAGEPETVLDIELCGQLKAWCRALPGTFGPGAAAGAGQ